MKSRFFLFIALSQSIYCYALEIDPSLYFILEKPVDAYVYNTGELKTGITPGDLHKARKTQYIYKAVVYIKNNEKNNIKVVTGNLAVSRQKADISDVTEIDIHDRQKIHKGSLVIPGESDLKLVELMPNETAVFDLEIHSFNEINKAKFSYTINDFYKKRFKSWSGRINSNVIETYK